MWYTVHCYIIITTDCPCLYIIQLCINTEQGGFQSSMWCRGICGRMPIHSGHALHSSRVRVTAPTLKTHCVLHYMGAVHYGFQSDLSREEHTVFYRQDRGVVIVQYQINTVYYMFCSLGFGTVGSLIPNTHSVYMLTWCWQYSLLLTHILQHRLHTVYHKLYSLNCGDEGLFYIKYTLCITC